VEEFLWRGPNPLLASLIVTNSYDFSKDISSFKESVAIDWPTWRYLPQDLNLSNVTARASELKAVPIRDLRFLLGDFMKLTWSIRVLFQEQRDTFTASSWREGKGNKIGRQFEDSFKRDRGASTAMNL
jgi:hypothetical protein